MKKVLILAFSALLCLATVNCLKCKLCRAARKGKCLAHEIECTADSENGTCVTVVNLVKNTSLYGCGTTKQCNVTLPSKIPKLIRLRYECCEMDFCNGAASSRGLLETH